jgi:hypothetical protein
MMNVNHAQLLERRADIRDEHLNPNEGIETAAVLLGILREFDDERVLVVGSPAAGKSTMMQHLDGCVDMDVIFDTMPPELRRYVLHHEYPFMYLDGDKKTVKYTENEFVAGDPECEVHLRATTDALTAYADEQLCIEAGKPVFGTNVIESDVIIHLMVSDDVLNEHLRSRNLTTQRPLQHDRVHAIRRLIAEDVELARRNGVKVVEFPIID